MKENGQSYACGILTSVSKLSWTVTCHERVNFNSMINLVFVFHLYFHCFCYHNHTCQEISEKKNYFCFTDYTKAFYYVNHNYGKFLKRWEYQNTLPASWEICMQQVKKQQLALDMEQQTGPNLRKEYIKGYILSHCLFNLSGECIM